MDLGPIASGERVEVALIDHLIRMYNALEGISLHRRVLLPVSPSPTTTVCLAVVARA